MDIRRKLQQIEARIGSTFDRKVSELVQARVREPLEIVHAVVDRAAREVQSSGRGRRYGALSCRSGMSAPHHPWWPGNSRKHSMQEPAAVVELAE